MPVVSGAIRRLESVAETARAAHIVLETLDLDPIAPRKEVRGAIGRRVVDHQDAVGWTRLFLQAVEALDEEVAPVVRHHHGADGHRAIVPT